MSSIRDSSIVKKITRMNMLVSATALLLACAAFVTYDMVTFRQSTVDELSTRAQIVGSNTISALLFNDPHAARLTLSALRADPHVISAAVYNTHGQLFAAYNREKQRTLPALPDLPPGQFQTYWSTHDQVVVVRSINFEGKLAGYVQIVSDQQRLYSRLERYGLIVIVVLIASLLAALAASRIFRRSISNRIVKLAETAHLIRRDRDYSLRAAATPEEDEITILIDAFNEMVETVQRRDVALLEARDELESRVEERTAEIAAANQRLEGANRQLEAQINEREKAQNELAKQSAELAETNTRLVEAEKIKSELFANVSHELRTPLTLILSPVETMLSGAYGQLQGNIRPALATVYNNALRLLQLVTGLLDFSKIDAGKVEVRREPLDMVAVTRSVLADFEPLMNEKGLQCTADLSASGVLLSVDRYLYERILFNLLSNAVKFTDNGGRIDVTLKWNEPALRLSVADTGVGIPESKFDSIFQKFRQLHGSSTRRFEGTGLGLALVKEFSGLLRGRVFLQSEVGKGSRFTVEIFAPKADSRGMEPALPARAAPRRTPAAILDLKPRHQTKVEESGRPRILIAEDNPELAFYLGSLLGGTYSIETAPDGEKALQLARRNLPDLVITDIMMPNRDGLSLCREIKANPQTAKIPVVLLTALTDQEALLKGWESGADEYLFKPFHPQELLVRIKSILSAVEQRRWAEEALGKLSGRLLHMQEEERRRIGRELHDSTAQILTALTINLTLLRPAATGADAATQKAVAECIALAEEASREIRSLSFLLHPPLLEDAGLLDALRWYAEGFAKRTGIAVDVHAPEEIQKLPRDTEAALFRVVQEALANVHRHSGSPLARITVEECDSELIVRIEDQGRGVPPEVLANWSNSEGGQLGVGLMGMKERMSQLGGKMEIISNGIGTLITATAPLAASQPGLSAGVLAADSRE